MNFIPNNDQDGFNSYISQDEFFNQSGLSFVPNNDQDGFNSYISQDEFFNQRGPMGGGIGGGSVSTGIGTGSSTSGGSVSTGIGTGGTTPSPTRNTNNSNGLTAGVVSMQVGIPPSIGSPAIPYSPPIPATPGSPAIPYVPAIPSTPAYNPNTSGGMSIGVTNQGTNPNQPCPCTYSMNCWDNNCPSYSTFFDAYRIILDKLEVKSLIRMKINLYPSTNIRETHPQHYDYSYKHKGCIFSLNTCDGATILEDGTEIKSVANRALLFNPQKLHSSTSTTNVKARLNVNINYF